MAYIFGSIWDRFNRNALNELSKSVEYQGESIQDLVAEGQLTPEQYAKLIQSVNGLISKGNIGLNDFSENVIAEVTKNNPEFKLLSVPRKNSVTPDATTFISGGKNKYDGSPIRGLNILSNGRVQWSESENTYSAVVPIEHGSAYTITKFVGGDRFAIALLEKHPLDYDLPVDSLYHYSGSGYATKQSHTFTNNVGANFVVIYTNLNVSNIPDVQVELGTNSTEFESYKPKFFGKDIVTKNDVQEISRSSLNLGVLVHPIGAINFNTQNGDIEFGEGIELLIFDNNKSVPKRTQVTPQKITTITPQYFQYKYVVYYRPSLSVFRVTNLNNYALTSEDIFLGTIQFRGTNDEIDISGFENYYVDGKGRSGESEEKTNKYLILDDISGIYNKPNDIESAALGEEFDLINSNHADVYQIYDELMSEFPENITKKSAGNDSSGLPIYEYKITPDTPNNESNFSFERPKITITTAVHGYEQLSAWSTALYFKDLMHNPDEKKELDYIKTNIEFAIMPVCNPYGYDNNQRTNFNGVDINRNFEVNWSATGNPGEDYYSGSSAGSEIETRIISNFLDENSDAIFHIDHHNISSGYPMVYAGTKLENQIGLNLFSTLTRKWQRDYVEAPSNTMFGYTKSTAGQGTMTAYSRTLMSSTTLETPWRMPFSNSKYDKKTIECAVDVFGNYLMSILKNLI